MQMHVLLNKMYEIEFGMFDHTDAQSVKDDPLAVIRAKPEESFITSSHLWDVAKRYAEAKIKERFGISFIEYSNLPMPEARLYERLAFDVFGKIELSALQRQNSEAEQVAAAAAAKKETPS